MATIETIIYAEQELLLVRSNTKRGARKAQQKTTRSLSARPLNTQPLNTQPLNTHPSNTRPLNIFHYLPAITLVVVLLDQFIKFFAAALPLGEKIALLPGIYFTHVRNTGISFGLLQGNNLLMIWVALIIFGALVYHHDKFTSIAARISFWLVIGGLFGNLLDRFFRGSVVDMFAVGWWPVFNIADSAICMAVAILVIEEILFLARRTNKNK